jgi:beta-fructofuranosidase
LVLLRRYHAGRFDLDNAKGPLRLDLGDTLYAPNVFRDDAGRVILWGWLQERRTVSRRL